MTLENVRLFIENKQSIPREQIESLISHIHQVPFATDLLEVDTQLWGSFWHFDVISPGYTLPASELALLRAMRLDHTWAEGTTIEQFQKDLHHAVIQPEAGIWSCSIVEQPCVIIAAPEPSGLITVVWYCLSTHKLHAGYRTGVANLLLPDAIEQCPPAFFNHSPQKETKIIHHWLDDEIYHNDNNPTGSLATQLDAEIVRIRALTSSTLSQAR
ncbi:MAG: hypothetical protein KDJ65_05660 [Anaerolineae bacterium]|nr:hypothetical protein [Anaerolineae bacterium]